MSTIPDTMKTISRDIQYTFEELVKLLMRKSLRPVLNPLKHNDKIIYNNFRRKYERGFVGSSPDDNINKYSYIMTNDSIGWTGEILTNFKVMAKFIKNNNPIRFPAGNAQTHNTVKSKSRVAYTDKELDSNVVGKTYNNFLTYLTSRSMHSVIANRKAAFSYTADIPYTHSFKQLESIGQDIIDQTDPCITGEDSAKMSTAMLRVKLYNLEQDLANFSVNYPEIFGAYLQMIRLVNSVHRSKLVWIINLVASLSYQNWDQLTSEQQQIYIDALGQDFMDTFNNNELITILLQSDSAEIILTGSYLYSLLKMLFIVFGYSKLTPVVTDRCGQISRDIYEEKMRKHLDKYRGGSFRRGETHSGRPCDRNYNYHPNAATQNNTDTDTDSIDSESPFYDAPCSTCPNSRLINRSNSYGSNQVEEPSDSYSESYPQFPCQRDIEPVDQCIYDFIKLFGDLYPTIIGLMGGTEEFPPEYLEIACDDVPPTYNKLSSLPEYLWRFNDYSYCKYLDYQGSKQLNNAIGSKINAKVKYLQSM